MASDSIFTSRSSEGVWVNLISRSLIQDLKTKIENPPSIFLVPTTIADEKPKAYSPQEIGLGPYHHLRPELYHMERKKLAAVRSVLKPTQILNFQRLFLSKLQEIETIIRDCYSKYLDIDGDTLLWILAIDGLFLLHHLSIYSMEHSEVDDAAKKLAQDIIMLENQIPCILLKTIRAALQVPDYDGDARGSTSLLYNGLYGLYYAFSRELSPLKLTDFQLFFTENEEQEIHHLLDFMYHFILNNRGFRSTYVGISISESSSFLENCHRINGVMATAVGKPKEQALQKRSKVFFKEFWEKASSVIRIKRSGPKWGSLLDEIDIPDTLPAQGNPQALALVNNFKFLKLLWDKIFSAFRIESSSDREKSAAIEEMSVPSVSQLSRTAKVKFKVKEGGIRDLKFDDKELIFYLPVITLNLDSEVVLRNLLAYEAMMKPAGSALELAEYIDLMSGIIDTVDDVGLLKEERIVEGDMTDEQIADMFSRFRKSRDENIKSNIDVAVDEVNERYKSRPTIKVCRFIKKFSDALWEIGKVIWKILAWISTIVVVFVLIFQSFCQVYGCPRRWF